MLMGRSSTVVIEEETGPLEVSVKQWYLSVTAAKGDTYTGYVQVKIGDVCQFLCRKIICAYLVFSTLSAI